jgi:hypothetical protein
MKQFLLIILALVSISSFAHADTNDEDAKKIDKAEKHAQKTIEACWAISEKLREGSTADMREGSGKSIECLTNEIENLSKKMFAPDKQKEFSEHLKRYTESAYFLNYKLYNEHKNCHPCGTQYHVVYLGATANTLEDLLKSMVQQAYEFDFIVDK